VDLVTNLADKIVPMWLIVYDQDPTQSYICNSTDKVFASVEGALYTAIPDADAEDLRQSLMAQLKSVWQVPFISLTTPAFTLFVHRLEIDKYNPVGRLLLDCFEVLPEGDLRERIAKIFVDPSVFDRSSS
jgi:hypothetical protein